MDTTRPGTLDRRAFLASTAAAAVGAGRADWPSMPHRSLPTPSASQLLWQRDELALFLHFGVNTFSGREWGDGRESPASFAPTALDARQWARTARAAGFRAMILTAKHHDGFCLWPTATTAHSVRASPFRGGDGDVVREFVDACRAEGLRAGLYLSPWDRNAPSYGDSPRYDALYTDQLTELLTRYGDIHEVWFDGANGEGPNGRRQQYDWARYWGLVRRLQPDAVIFSDAGPDLRWIGNERGSAGETNWSMVDPALITRPGMSGDAVMRQLQEGDADGTVWRPGETDVSIRPGWFWRPAEDGSVRDADDLLGLYFSSVGRNSKLLLNVPPTTAGRLAEVDVAALAAMRSRLTDTFGDPVPGSALGWRATGARTGEALLEGIAPGRPLAVVDLREEISTGQRVARHVVECLTPSGWQVIAAGTTIGYRRLHRVASTAGSALRVRVETIDQPLPIAVRLYGG
jgi:alpha-L-fucosidase